MTWAERDGGHPLRQTLLASVAIASVLAAFILWGRFEGAGTPLTGYDALALVIGACAGTIQFGYLVRAVSGNRYTRPPASRSLIGVVLAFALAVWPGGIVVQLPPTSPSLFAPVALAAVSWFLSGSVLSLIWLLRYEGREGRVYWSGR